MRLSPEELNSAVKGCMSGDRRCQHLIFQAFFGKMLTVCMRYTKDKDAAQDVLQDAFIKAFEKMPYYNFSGSFEGWLRRIVVNTSIDNYRKSKNTFFLEDEASVADEDDGGGMTEEEEAESMYAQIKPEMVMDAVQQLSPAYQTVFNLYVYENMSHQEIADTLNISVGTSKSNLAKAKMKLQKLLRKHLNYKNV